MNIYQVSKDVFRFRLWNLNRDSLGLAGHFTIWWHRPTGNYVLGQHGGFGGLTWYPHTDLKPVKPTEDQVKFLKSIIDDELKYARFYDGEKIHGHGEYLMNQQNVGEYVSYCSRLIFNADSPLTRISGEKLIDDEAIAMLEGEGVLA